MLMLTTCNPRSLASLHLGRHSDIMESANYRRGRDELLPTIINGVSRGLLQTHQRKTSPWGLHLINNQLDYSR